MLSLSSYLSAHCGIRSQDLQVGVHVHFVQTHSEASGEVCSQQGWQLRGSWTIHLPEGACGYQKHETLVGCPMLWAGDGEGSCA